MKRPIDELKQDVVFGVNFRGRDYKFHSTWGLFSPAQIDEGTKLLMDCVETKPTDTIIDIGCGYGVPGIPLAAAAPQGKVHMVDKDFVAVEYAKKNAAINGLGNCEIYLSNGFSNVPKGIKFDTVVSNLPAKSGRELFDIILYDAEKRLKPGGRFYVVTISGLKEFIKNNFKETFGNYEKVKQGKNYTVALAVKE